MKFIELKSCIKNKLNKVYVLEGNDRYVILSSIELIERKLALNFPDVNKMLFNEENKYSMDDILQSVSVIPFGDDRKLVIVWDCNLKNDYGKLENFVKKDTDENFVLVFAFTASNEFSKKMKNIGDYVDCNKLDDVTLSKWIVANVTRAGVQIEEGAVALLVNYCNNNLARISSETDKLTTINVPVIKVQHIKDYVVPDREYQIYELTDAISKNDKIKVFDIVNTMLAHDKFQIGLLQYLYGSFRRLFYISISSESDDVLAQMFKIKPYAVKMARQQASKFTPKELKRINAQLSSLEFDIKSGRANSQTAINYAICRILLVKEV